MAQVSIPTLGEAVAAYYREELEPRRHRPKTEQSVLYNLSLLPKHFGSDTPLDQIDTRRISEWRSCMLSSGLSPASVNCRLSDLRSILNRAVR